MKTANCQDFQWAITTLRYLSLLVISSNVCAVGMYVCVHACVYVCTAVKLPTFNGMCYFSAHLEKVFWNALLFGVFFWFFCTVCLSKTLKNLVSSALTVISNFRSFMKLRTSGFNSEIWRDRFPFKLYILLLRGVSIYFDSQSCNCLWKDHLP